MKIYTSRFSYRVPEEYIAVGIAVGKPRWALPYKCEHLSMLAPHGLFKKYQGEEFKRRYMDRLEELGEKKIRTALEAISKRNQNKDIVLLCWENLAKGLVCHRRYFADWWKATTGEEVEELEQMAQRSTVRKAQMLQLTLF